MIEGKGGTDHEKIRALAWREPQTFARLMDVLVDATSQYLIAQGHAGAEALQLFESWAATVPAGLFEAAVLNPTARIVANVKAQHPGLPIIGFPRGAGGWLTRYAEATGVNGIGVDQMTDIAAVNVPSGVALQGNLDPILLLQGGDAFFPALIEAMDAARQVVHVETYIFEFKGSALALCPMCSIPA